MNNVIDMRYKKTSIKSVYFLNILIFLSFAISIKLMDASLKIWYIFFVLFVTSVFETIFFYKINDKSFKAISNDKAIQVFLLAIGSTVVLIGSILFIVCILI